MLLACGREAPDPTRPGPRARAVRRWGKAFPSDPSLPRQHWARALSPWVCFGLRVRGKRAVRPACLAPRDLQLDKEKPLGVTGRPAWPPATPGGQFAHCRAAAATARSTIRAGKQSQVLVENLAHPLGLRVGVDMTWETRKACGGARLYRAGHG